MKRGKISRGWPKGKKHKKGWRENISKGMKKYYSNPESIKKHSRVMKKAYSSPSARLRMSRSIKKMYRENPELIKKIDRTVTRWWREHPNIRKERSETLKKLFIKNPSKFSNFMKYGKNPNQLRLRTKKGFLVRSKGEQTIANFLHDNNIQNSYESKTLIFKEEGQICVPDFYLPKYKIYIEFYGGHPKAWKKKVMKNKLYKNHKIPCIFITPAELRDLNYYLMGELGKGKESIIILKKLNKINQLRREKNERI